MLKETRVCQNCKKDFPIEPEDFEFYTKIKVPAPTWCPDCRFLRRMSWRNERFLYRVKDAHNDKEIFSMYPAQAGLKVFEKDFWNSDGWDQNASGREYDFSKPFFEQFKELLKNAPFPNRATVDLVNSDYSNNATALKNCYLVFASSYVEDSYYSENCAYSKETIDGSSVNNSEVSYECFSNNKCYRGIFSANCEECSDIWFCRDCVNVSNCFGCAGLKNKSYCFYNEQLSEEEYEKRLASLNLSSYESLTKVKKEAAEKWLNFPSRFLHTRKNENSSGEYVSNSKNVKESYYVKEGEDLKFCQYLFVQPIKDAYDQSRFGNNTSLVYEGLTVGGDSTNIKFGAFCFTNCSNLQYCCMLNSSSDCFGCVSIHHKKFCILNKQYSEEEYKALVPKIIKQMEEMPYTDTAGRTYKYGEFFPTELSPIPYNHSVAKEYFPMNKESALKNGSYWLEEEKKNYQITIEASALPDKIEDAPDSITKEMISCLHKQECGEECTSAFRILSEELAFYRKLDLPLPRLCPNCRYAERIKQRNSFKLYQRNCQCGGAKSENGKYANLSEHPHKENHCPNKFETSYSPNRSETVYCETCYQNEVV